MLLNAPPPRNVTASQYNQQTLCSHNIYYYISKDSYMFRLLKSVIIRLHMEETRKEIFTTVNLQPDIPNFTVYSVHCKVWDLKL